MTCLVPLVFGDVTDAGLETLLADPHVLSVEPDIEMPLTEWRAGSFNELALASVNQSLPWGVDRVTAPAAWALRSPALDGKGIKIAFIAHQRQRGKQPGCSTSWATATDSFLAWVEYTGTSPHAALMARVMALPPAKSPAGARPLDSRE